MSASDPLELSGLSEDDLLAFYGALFAMSATDRDMDEAEDDRIFQSLDMADLSEEARKRTLHLAIDPPPLERCLLQFQDHDREIRRGLMLNLIDVVLADDLVEPAEHVSLHEARQVLGIAREDMADLHEQAARTNADATRPLRPAPLPKEPFPKETA